MDARDVNKFAMSMYTSPKERDQIIKSLARSLEQARKSRGEEHEEPLTMVSGVPLYRSDFDGVDDVRQTLLARDLVLSKTRVTV